MEQDQADKVVAVVADIEREAIADVRKYLPLVITDRFVPGVHDAIDRCRGRVEILGALRTFPSMREPELQEALTRFETTTGEQVSADFQAGIVFALRLFADYEFEF